MSPLGVPFEREVAPSRRGPGSSVVTLVGLPMALLLLVALCHGGILSPRESAAPHTNAVFIATFFANFGESPECELRHNGVLGSSRQAEGGGIISLVGRASTRLVLESKRRETPDGSRG